MKNKQAFAMLLSAAAQIIFGFSFMFSRIAMQVSSPTVMLMYRFVLSFVLVNLLVLFTRGWPGTSDWMRVSFKGKKLLPLIALGLLQPVAYFICESNGINLTNSTTGGVIISFIPLVSLAAGFLFLKEKVRWQQVLFALLSIFGLVVMTLQQQSAGDIRFAGIVLLFGAVFSAAFYSVLSRGIAEQYTAMERTYVMMGTGAVTFTLLAVGSSHMDPAVLLAPISSPAFWGCMLYLAAVSSILAFLFVNYGLSYLPIARVSAFTNLTTVVSVFAGAVFLGEPFNLIMLLASVFIIVGVWGVQKYGQ